MKDEIKEIINDLQRVADRKCYPEDILDGSIAQEWVDYITNLQEENERLKDIRNQAINYNKALCKIYDCGIELSNAETNLCILKDEETINTLQGKSDE